MENLLLLFAAISSGIILRHSGLFGPDSARVLNRLIIYFFIPVLALYHVPKITLRYDLILLTLTPFLVFFASLLFFQACSRFNNWDHATKSALMLTAGISSTSFVGFPIFELLYGPEGLAYGLILSLSGTILVFNTAGVATLFYLSSGQTNWKHLSRSVLLFPPFIAFVLALALNLSAFSYPQWLDQILGRLAAPFSVIALLSIGMQVDFKTDPAQWKHLSWGLTYKLIAAPILVYLLVWLVLDVQSLVGQICILGAAIGPMNAMSILTAEKNLNPSLAILMPTIGIPLSIPVLFLLYYLLGA